MEIPLEILTEPAETPLSLDLGEALTVAERSLEAALAQGAETFVLAYSGGKDSTATTVLTLEWWKRRGKPVEVHVIYADTGLEIPTLHAQALGFLEAVKGSTPRSVSTSPSPARRKASGSSSSARATPRPTTASAGAPSD